jgi:hypothetical protein
MKVTDDNFMNINPKLLYTHDSIFIIYQTNKNGNWDIACRASWNNQPFNSAHYIADSSADEINPVVAIADMGWSNGENQFVSYEKGNSVYIRNMTIHNSVEFELFHGNDTTKYSQVSQKFITYNANYLCIAARKVVNGKSSIVYRNYGTKGWEDEIVLVSSDNCRNPRILVNNMRSGITYIDDIYGISNIILIENFSQPIDTLKLFGYPRYNYDNISTLQPVVLTKRKVMVINNPLTYTASVNDSLFIRINQNESGLSQTDTLIYTKVKNSNLYLGSFDVTRDFENIYTIWEDSISGNIQLFGRKFLYPLFGDVKDKNFHIIFTLSQNYPNPFNPSTTINYSLPKAGNVKLTIYNVIGSRVSTIVDEYKPAGNYSVQFNGSNLASGIYLYRLEAGNYSEAKKLILMK